MEWETGSDAGEKWEKAPSSPEAQPGDLFSHFQGKSRVSMQLVSLLF